MNDEIAQIRQMTKQRNDLNYEIHKAFQSLKVSHNNTVVTSTQLLLSYRGRILELTKDVGCCGVPDFKSHVEQCADPTSWVHSSLEKWIKLGIENPEEPKNERTNNT